MIVTVLPGAAANPATHTGQELPACACDELDYRSRSEAMVWCQLHVPTLCHKAGTSLHARSQCDQR